MTRWLLAGVAVTACILTAVPGSAVSLSDIKGRGRAIVATSGNLPPNTFVDERNQLTGYDVEVCRLVEKALGVPMTFERLDWKGILPGLQTGRFDLVCSTSTSPTSANRYSTTRYRTRARPWSRSCARVLTG